MAKKTIYRTIISFVVLSEEQIPENTTLGDIINESDEGAYIMGNVDKKETELVGKVAVNEIYKLGSEPSFFKMDDEGNEEEETPYYPYEDIKALYGEEF